MIESPSRRYIQRSSESQIAGLGSMTSNTQNNSCQSFAMYEWASMDSAPDTDSDEKISGDYVFNSSSFQVSDWGIAYSIPTRSGSNLYFIQEKDKTF